MARRTRVLCALLVLLFPLDLARAEHTRFWRQSDYESFERGTAAGVAVRSDGKLTPAPRFASFADPNLGYLWALCLDAQGRLYAAGGSDAKVLRFDATGKPTTVFESSELTAQALAFDAKGNLFVATSPDGKVYKVAPDGTKSVFFDPKAKYIWSLVVDAQGNLFVGTGDKGEIFVVSPDGNGKSFYESGENHARSMALDSKGNLLVGTEPNGLIMRLPITRKTPAAAPEAGSPFVLYQTNHREVTSLMEDGHGNLYAASIGDKSRSLNLPLVAASIPQPAPAAASPVNVQIGSTAGPQPQVQAAPPGVPAALLGTTVTGAEVVKIASDDSPAILWTSRDQIVLALGLSPEGDLLLGTGNRGEIFRLESNGIYSDIEQTSAVQVTSLLSGPGGIVYAASANPGKVFTLGPGLQPDGSFVSNTFDANIFSRWGRLTWSNDNPRAGGRVEFFVRSGNTSNPEKNWSAWAGPYKEASGESVACPPARFVQWKAVFLSADAGSEPVISWVNLAFLPKNVAPVIDDIAIQDPGVRMPSSLQQPNPAGGGPAPLRLPQRANAASNPTPAEAETAPRLQHNEIFLGATQDHSYQSVLWSAHDDNDDDLTFSIYFRGAGETSWRLLKDKITEHFYSWDTSTIPDGAYNLKIVASDAPSNPVDEALSAERESDRFDVGNTPPRVEDLQAAANGASATLTFRAASSSGALVRAAYSLDAGDWQILFPGGQLTDAPQESYRWTVTDLGPGEHTIAVRITDRFGNLTAAKTTFTMAASARTTPR